MTSPDIGELDKEDFAQFLSEMSHPDGLNAKIIQRIVNENPQLAAQCIEVLQLAVVSKTDTTAELYGIAIAEFLKTYKNPYAWLKSIIRTYDESLK